MAAPEKYLDEVWERAIRPVRDLAADGVTVTACRRVGQQLGIDTDTLRCSASRQPIRASGARRECSSGHHRFQSIALGMFSSPSDHHASCPGARVR